ncbi:hypothetical protein EV643_1395 [Kribbella sp. VKM Ac-2527]|uniref:Uncharacterized protein n=1 Tax=Kribbella caucasensis TaxID=2512215 RepID=A0A4R6J755_9ACTN|nr:hypothetical protein [Kribbella sp. VKM Ac-2527]TDO30206.1 hypothetical protein EV643_1395 [Kribbella sp. VKM Ac-2527]
MRQLLRSKLVYPIVILILLCVLILALLIRWQAPPSDSAIAQAAETPAGGEVSEESFGGLEAWTRPATTDPREFALAYSRAIWTYNTSVHGYYEWRDAVSVFADPTDPPEGPRIARSMLPYAEQWEQLKLHNGRAEVTSITADSTPELKVLERDPRAPAGWHGYVVRGTQTSVVDDQVSVAQRQVTVGVVCLPRCKFWSATAEGPR